MQEVVFDPDRGDPRAVRLEASGAAADVNADASFDEGAEIRFNHAESVSIASVKKLLRFR